jgi:hypothetical protein
MPVEATDGLGVVATGSESTRYPAEDSVAEFPPLESVAYTETVYDPATVGVQVMVSLVDATLQPKLADDCVHT